MLAAPLLRIRASSKKGLISPLFCTRQEDIELAARIIREFQESWKNKEKRFELDSRIAVIESEYGVDYKLVRGLCALLERRCAFKTGSEITLDVNDDNVKIGNGVDNSNTRNSFSTTTNGLHNNNNSNSTFVLNPIEIRKALFEESSKRGFALTDYERKEIIGLVASRWHLSPFANNKDDIANIIWSDLEENQVLDRFDDIDAESLVGWYNLSLIQTLLFNCTKMEFSVSGGSNWKRILRSVKRLGLMYYLQERENAQQQQDHGENAPERRIVCSLEGPSSLFRLTDRYGTALAKLLPSIILRSSANGSSSSLSSWDIHAWIVRRTLEGQRALYEFKLSNKEAPLLLADPLYYFHHHQPQDNGNKSYFDSAVEEKFARRFVAASESTGWRLIREPDPLIVSGGKAFIPDFVFEKYDRRVYLEIVGFWTPEYLERKLKKLADIILANENAKRAKNLIKNDDRTLPDRVDALSSRAAAASTADLFVAINRDLACSSTALSSLSFHIIPKDRLMQYSNDAVPIRPILDYLKSIDKELVESSINDTGLKVEIDCTKEVIPLQDIVITARDKNIAANSHNRSLPPEVVLKVAMRDYGDKLVEVAGTYLISKRKMEKLQPLLASAIKFTEACKIMTQNDIPESCHAELISKLGYDVVWQSLDPSTAIILKREKTRHK
jgi:predicted nuclease of restriction endonuclease-like RecB superfamily